MDGKHKMRCIRSGLRQACEELSSRGLYLSSKWASEQLYSMIEDNTSSHSDGGIPSCDFDSDDNDQDDHYDDDLDMNDDTYYKISSPHAIDESNIMTRREKDYIHLGQNLIMNGEYLRCAHMLRK